LLINTGVAEFADIFIAEGTFAAAKHDGRWAMELAAGAEFLIAQYAFGICRHIPGCWIEFTGIALGKYAGAEESESQD
tara:strand:- start:28512 stop:28745 length:234 start_codon:yes stop_codon:yes gene_type:complete